MITALGSRIILPSEYAEWVKKCPDLSHQALTSEVRLHVLPNGKDAVFVSLLILGFQEFFAGYPGFEGETMVADPSEMLISMIKTKMSQNKCELRDQRGSDEPRG